MKIILGAVLGLGTGLLGFAGLVYYILALAWLMS